MRDPKNDHHIKTQLLRDSLVKGRSRTTQLISCLDTWIVDIDKWIITDMVYSDFSKKCDGMSHNILLEKIRG